MKVLVFQRVLPHYRHDFFLKLNDYLANSGVTFLLVYGFESPNSVPKTIMLTSDFALPVKTKYFSFFGHEIVWLPIDFKRFFDSDVVVIEQASRILSNYIIVMLCLVMRKKLVFWGHARNYQNKKSGFLAWFKQAYTSFSSGFIAYTKNGRDYLVTRGYEASKAFFVNNSVKIENAANVRFESSQNLTFEADLAFSTTNMAVYCGGMYKHKRLEFLLQAALLIKKHVPDFSLVLIGDGPDAQLAIDFAAKYPDWVHYAGFLIGANKASVFARAKLQFMPGLVGLAVIDSFVFEVPIVTTDIDYHSPEFEYILHGKNGLVTEDSLNAYVATVVEYLTDESKMAVLKAGCRESANYYTVDNMVSNFANAILTIAGKKNA